MSWLSDAFSSVGNFFSNLFSSPKVSLPQVTMPTITTPQALPTIKAPAKPKVPSGAQQDIGQFSKNLSPTLQSILGLSVPRVSPGMLIPGVNNDNS